MTATAMSSERRPWVAALLSLFAAGLGHLYAGSVRGALGWWIAAAGAIVLTPALVLHFPVGGFAVLLIWAVPVLMLVAPAVSAARIARRAPRPYPLQPFNRWWIYPSLFLLSAGITQGIVTPFLRRSMEAFRITSASMEPAILMGDFLYMEKPARDPLARGMLVAFTSVEEPGLKVLKRIVALAGDTIGMRAGTLTLDGRPVAEPYVLPVAGARRGESPEYREKMRQWQASYLARPDTAYAPDLNSWGPLVVPAESVFVLGDNREASYDGRFWGFLPTASIIGEPRLIYYSYDPESQKGARWLTAARWDRIGLRLP